MAWQKLGSDTLGSAGDDLDITYLTAKKFNQSLIHTLDTAVHRCNTTFDNNANTDYAYRSSLDGGTDTTTTEASLFLISNSSDGDQFIVMYSCNIGSEEKLSISFCCDQVATGATQAPSRREVVAKVDTTTNTVQYTRIDINNTDVGSFDTGSNISVLGTD